MRHGEREIQRKLLGETSLMQTLICIDCVSCVVRVLVGFRLHLNCWVRCFGETLEGGQADVCGRRRVLGKKVYTRTMYVCTYVTMRRYSEAKCLH